MLKLVNLKDGEFNVELALATVEIEIEQAKKEGVVAIKVLHGYGSHGRGGIIAFELRKMLSLWKRQGFITNYFGGDKWNLFDEDSQKILLKDKSIYNDTDISSSNPGITIIEI